MASGIKFLGYTNHMGGDATVRFAIRGQEYDYNLKKNPADAKVVTLWAKENKL